MICKKGSKEDISDIMALAKKYGQTLSDARVTDDLERYPSEVMSDEKGFLGFVLCEEISSDIILVYSLAVREEARCSATGRHLLEILESRAAEEGYYGIVVSGFVQKALLGCASDIITFAGYRKIYDTGGSCILAKSIR